MLGEKISHYKILARIGQGASGVVYKAADLKLNRTVALKFLAPNWQADQDAGMRFQREAQAASALDHPNICTIHEIDETPDGRPFIVMAYYDGHSLKDRIQKGPLEILEAIDITRQLCAGISKAHEAGIIHRDLKPANILLTADGVVKILDFGVAKLAGSERLTKSGSTLGTIAYMAPEQIQDIESVDHRADIWSLGVIFFEMLTGELPFEGEFEQILMYAIVHKQAKAVAEFREDVSETLQSIIDKTLAKSAAERFQVTPDLCKALETIDDGSKRRAEQKSPGKIAPQKRPPAKIHLSASLRFAAIALTVLAFGLVFLKVWRTTILYHHKILYIPSQPLLGSPSAQQNADLNIAIFLPKNHETVINVGGGIKFPEILSCKSSDPKKLASLGPYASQLKIKHFWAKATLVDKIIEGFFDRIDDLGFWNVVGPAINGWLLLACVVRLRRNHREVYDVVARIPKMLHLLWGGIGASWIFFMGYFHKKMQHGVLHGAFWTIDFIPGVRTTQIVDFIALSIAALAGAYLLVLKLQLMRVLIAKRHKRFFTNQSYCQAWELLINSGYCTFIIICIMNLIMNLVFIELITEIDIARYAMLGFVFQAPFLLLTLSAWILTRNLVDYKFADAPITFFWISTRRKSGNI